MRVSAKADYAVRAMVELAAADAPIKAERLAEMQAVPAPFLVKILYALQAADLVVSQRGPEGGHRLARPADETTLADVLRAIDGALADVHGVRPENLELGGSAEPLKDVWLALRQNIRAVLENVTLADVAAQDLPAEIEALANLGVAKVRA